MTRYSIIFGVFVTVALGACKEGGDATGSTCPTPQTLTYQNFGSAFMDKYCTRCHGNESPSLTTQASIASHAALIDKWAASGPNATNTDMPEGSPTPTTEERAKLGEWLACGAP